MSSVIITEGNIVSKKSSHNRKLVQIIFNDSSLVSRLICYFKPRERKRGGRERNAFVLDPDPPLPIHAPCAPPPSQIGSRPLSQRGDPSQQRSPFQTPSNACLTVISISFCFYWGLALLKHVHIHTRRIHRISNQQVILCNSGRELLASASHIHASGISCFKYNRGGGWEGKRTQGGVGESGSWLQEEVVKFTNLIKNEVAFTFSKTTHPPAYCVTRHYVRFYFATETITFKNSLQQG